MQNIKTYKSHFWDFYNSLSKEAQDKVDYTLLLIQRYDWIPVKFYKHITNGIYTIRVRSNFLAIRIFNFRDADQTIILLHGFKKKTQKLPRQEVKKALRLRDEYFTNSNSRNN